ncbi:MAG: DUF4440 domain-containing protein [Methylococcaceae bacterium]|jgi:hypothetical protein
MNLLVHELQALEAELHHPGLICTRERLEALLHADFHEVGRSGRQYTRATVISYLIAQAEPPQVTTSAYVAQNMAEGCALLTYQSSLLASDGTVSLATFRSSIWLRTKIGWQLFYHQGTPSAAEI